MTSLLAVAFVNPALLGGLGLVTLPVLIHLLSRRQFRLIEWGAMSFLLEAEKENRRRVRFEQWLLVLLRCLAMALLALLLARPFVEPGLVASLLGSRGETQRIILIDDSASLAFRAGNTQDFALLREAGQRLLGWLHEGVAGDRVTVYLTSRPTEPLVAEERLSATTLEDLQARLGKLSPSNLPARPRRSLEAIAKNVSTAGRSIQADLYVLSDFQRSEWLASDSAGTSVFEPLTQCDPDSIRVVLIATGPAARDNAAILTSQLERPQTVAGVPAVINATVANFSTRILEGVRVQVEVDGAPLPPVPVKNVAAGQSQTVSVEVTFPDEGYSELAVNVDAVDGLPADNTNRLVLPVQSALAVLLVNGEPATDPVRDEVYFLRNALSPAGPFSSGNRVGTIDPDEIEAVDLDVFDCVALCNVAAPGPGAVAALQRYVRIGGGLVFFLGDQVGDPDEYNRAFYAGGEGLLPLPLRELRRSDQDAAVGLVRVGDHPVTAMFPAGGASLSEYVRFREYYQCLESPAELTTDASPTDRGTPPIILARFTDSAQTPALIEQKIGQGRVLLFTSSVDLDWNNWARSIDGSYVVTMLELVQYVARSSREPYSFVAGDTLDLSLAPDEYEPTAVFRAPPSSDDPPVEAHLREPVAAVGEPVVLEGPVARRLGRYTAELVRRGGGTEKRPLAVNLDTGESDLSVAGARELDLALGPVSHEYVQATEAFLNDDEQARRELWPAVLLTLVAILMLEQLLAWWFGTPGHARTRRLWSLLGRATPQTGPGRAAGRTWR